MRHPDQLYIYGLLANDKNVIEKIYQNFFSKIKGMIIKNNGSSDDASDIFQEALITIYNKAKKTDFELTCPFEAFLWLICRKKWINVLNKNKNFRVTNIDEEGYNFKEDSLQLAEETILQEERLKLLSDKLALLGDACRQLLEYSWQGFSMQEVADHFGYSFGYARKKKSICVAKLISEIKQSPDYNILKW
ncbi:RNA polymerase sigma factor [Cognataquiflexum rubidum]|uniref:RNA polymerase sigma factor n=1 Tax=Cognataquiflexum rubidum TaxID=2922273 RepID=UPI001F138160|nr:sigma-70 family RNA polymerase sigma factor [Cognataquiflexum rubidum]MCH6234185.1 RNA polymerase sigma factor [Cognataquiflexum rubidum]